MMWQDGLALFIVLIAALVVLRIYAPVGIFRFGVRHGGDDPARNAATAAGGCGGCAVASSCFKEGSAARTLFHPYGIDEVSGDPPGRGGRRSAAPPNDACEL